ncbi:MAG TPA: SRPBCC family protein [Gaiellaceae bacterium]|nr:SRPBCC family protein [Gaiellaceae bacterium]
MRIVRSVEIAAPPERVFAVVTDLSTHPRWRPSVREFRTAGGEPPAVGSEIVEVVRFAGRDVRMRYRVTELEPPHVFAAGYVDGPIEVAIRFDCAPAGEGTLAAFTCDTARPRIARVLPFPFFGPLMGRYMDDELGNLKSLVESGEV